MQVVKKKILPDINQQIKYSDKKGEKIQCLLQASNMLI